MDYTPNINTQGMRQPMGPVDQPNWNGGPRLNHNPQVMNNRAVGQPNLSNAMANQQPIIPISYVRLLFLHLQYQIHMLITGLDATADQLITVAAN